MEREFLVNNRKGWKVTVKGGRRPRLEVRSTEDFGWYDGTVALVHEVDDGEGDPEKLQVRVHFTGFDDKYDEIWGLEVLGSEYEIRSRVRLLSHQLQDRECRKVFPGMFVCANYKSPDGVDCKYFDAVITSVCKRPHEKKNREEICHCGFTARWEEGPLKGTFVTLKCPDITLIVPRDVGHHPIVQALLDFAKDFSAATPLVSKLGKPEGNCSPRYEVSSHSAPILEYDGQDILEIEGMSSQEAVLVKSNHMEELNVELDKREENVGTGVVEEVDAFRIEKLCVSHLEVHKFYSGKEFESKDLHGPKVYSEHFETEEARISAILGMEPEIVGMEIEEEEKQVREESHEEILVHQKKSMTKDIEIDWDEELEIEKFMDELGLHHRVCEDEFLDLPRDVAEHLKNFQKVQDCLQIETLELEKFLI